MKKTLEGEKAGMIMKRLLIHTEYICILNLIALPFIVMLNNRGSLMMWALLVFLDAVPLLLKVDLEEILYALRDEELRVETTRIKIYLCAILAFYISIPFVADWKLLTVLIINDMVTMLLVWLFQRYVYEEEENGGEES